ncbi:MAG: AsmA family protein [Sphingobacteriales bacterium]|nr:MAG: AsmA family protein [Sphingobacteriales bacterium]
MLKKTLKISAAVVGVLLLLAFTAPLLFRKQIVAALKSGINRNVAARVDFNDVSISFFRRFPRVSVAVEGVQVVGTGDFAGDTLLQAARAEAALNFWSVVKGSDFRIHAVQLDDPRINALVRADGRANWDIALPDTATSAAEPTPFSLVLEHYAVRNAQVRYTDEGAGLETVIRGLDHEGSGDFTADLFTLKTKTRAGALSVRYGAIPWLSEVATTLDADVAVDNKTNTYTLQNTRIALNDLELETAGSVQLLNDSTYKMDLAFKAPSTGFKELLSLIPALYQKEFNKIKTGGTARFDGFVKGTYSPTQLPAFAVNLDVANGSFQYPDLPRPVRNINLALHAENPDGVPDHTAINIPKAHLEFDGEAIDGRLALQRPVTDMLIDAAVKGRLDLGRLASMVKLDAGTKLAGQLQADVQLKGSVAALQQKRYDGFSAAGTMALSNFHYASKEYPDAVQLQSAQAAFTPRNLSIPQLAGQYGTSRFSASGTIDNLLAYVLKGQALAGALQLRADKLDLNRFLAVAPDSAAAKADPAGPFLVPANLDLAVTAAVGEVLYDKMNLQQVSGRLAVRSETVYLRELRARALDGTMRISGSYSTLLDKKKPDIALSYDVQGLDVQKTFLALNTVQKLMPIARFMGGKLTSQLTVAGKLGDGMMPDMASLTGKGNLLLLEGVLQKFAPVDKLASMLQIESLQHISLKEVRNYFEFANGKVLVKPFTVKVAGMEIEAGGLHGFEGSMEYVLNMKVPRAKLGAGANKFVNNLSAQAVANGIPVKLSETVNLKVRMGGTVSKPQVQTALKESAASLTEDLKVQATAFVKARADSAKQTLRDSVKAVKDGLLQSAKGELLKGLTGQKDTAAGAPPTDIKKKAENTGKALLNGLFGKKQKDTTQH